MRFLAVVLSLLSTSAVAYPVTYLFSGTVTTVNGNLNTPLDPTTPLIVDGQTVFNGETAASGSFSFDSEASQYNFPGDYPGVSRDHLIVDVWSTIEWTLAAEGYTAVGNPHHIGGSNGVWLWNYSDTGFSGEYEGDTNSPFTRSTMVFNFAPSGTDHAERDYLLTENFTGGTFRFYLGDGCGRSKTAPCAMAGTIDSIRVPEPATVALFGLGVAGLALARRRRKQ